MSPGPRAVEVRLSDGERAELSRWVSGAVASRFAERARIVLACAGGAPNAQVAVEVGVTVATVRKWRGKFAADGLAGLEDAARIGRPKADLVLSADERGQLVRWARRAKTAHVHFTPTGSSWITQVERWFGLLTDKLIRRGVHTSVKALEDDIRAWIETWNEDPKPFAWTKTADEILKSLADYLTKITPSNPGNQAQT
ncbi:helix-turn-helix domain-containing protein [Streptomyces sp. NBC_01207]|uniref:helix-turn-helix domain-containing protein n=1 Tax=Streptomyces sp. NBC_01207 TaxID=2903772 RepID=UPI002E12EDCA|nr:helix-turn-helix domain-containing protein [Streptomyces sp. NBC_01207]